MPKFSQQICGTTLVVFTIILGSCNRAESDKTAQNQSPSAATTPTTDDVWVAKHAMTVSDVLLMLKGGDSQETIIAEVKRRHFVGNVVEATELQLTLAGARHELIYALKNKGNWLTEPQEQAYGQLMAQHQAPH